MYVYLYIYMHTVHTYCSIQCTNILSTHILLHVKTAYWEVHDLSDHRGRHDLEAPEKWHWDVSDFFQQVKVSVCCFRSFPIFSDCFRSLQ